MKSIISALFIFGFCAILIWSSPPDLMSDYQGVLAAGLKSPWPYESTGKGAPTNPDGYWDWTIFDRPDAEKMLITYPHFNDLQARYTFAGKEYSDAAKQYLLSTKRADCTVQYPMPVNSFFVEVKYSCNHL